MMNAHVIEYYLWQIKKDALWYWFPYLQPHPGVVSDCSC